MAVDFKSILCLTFIGLSIIVASYHVDALPQSNDFRSFPKEKYNCSSVRKDDLSNHGGNLETRFDSMVFKINKKCCIIGEQYL